MRASLNEVDGDVGPMPEGALESILDRVRHDEFDALRAQLRSSGYCCRPIRLSGQTRD